MKKFRICSIILIVLFVQLAALAVFFCFSPVSSQPVLLLPSQEAQLQAKNLLSCVCQGDFAGAEQYLLGTPSLGVNRPAADPVGVLFWDAFTGSLSYELQGNCFATASGLGQAATVAYLDIDATAASLHQRSEELLQQRLEDSLDPTQIYDSENNYREDVVMEVFTQAVQDALSQDAAYRTVTVTVNLVHRDGQWWIVPDAQLLSAISGGIIQ